MSSHCCCTATVINYLGEKLAYGLGITTPDWQYAIDLYEDLEREEREEREAEERALRQQQEEALKKMREMEDAANTAQELDSSEQSLLSRTSD